MVERFGDFLRRTRKQAGFTLGKLARELEVSLTYLSDVERNERPPLNASRIDRVGQILRVEPSRLHEAAAMSRGTFNLQASRSPTADAVGAALLRGWSDFDDDDFKEILEVTKRALKRRQGQ